MFQIPFQILLRFHIIRNVSQQTDFKTQITTWADELEDHL